MGPLKKLNDCLLAVTKWLSIVFFVIMLLAASAQILLRFVFSMPLAWSDEVSKYAFVWSTMLGCAYLARTNGHSCVEALGNILKGNSLRAQKILIDLICLLIYVVIAIGGVRMMKAGYTSVTPALGMPMYMIYSIMPLMGGLMTLFHLEIFLKNCFSGEGNG